MTWEERSYGRPGGEGLRTQMDLVPRTESVQLAVQPYKAEVSVVPADPPCFLQRKTIPSTNGGEACAASFPLWSNTQGPCCFSEAWTCCCHVDCLKARQCPSCTRGRFHCWHPFMPLQSSTEAELKKL